MANALTLNKVKSKQCAIKLISITISKLKTPNSHQSKKRWG